MVLKGSNATAPAQGKGAESVSGQSLPERVAPDEMSEIDIEQLSFAPLPHLIRPRARSTVETRTRAPPKPLASDSHPHPLRIGIRHHPVAPPMPQSDRHSPTLLLVACAFVLGAGAAVGGTYLLGGNPSLEEMRRLPWMASERENADHVEGSSSGAAPSGSMRSLVGKLSRDYGRQNQAERETDSQELTALGKQVDRQFVDGHLDQPAGDDALETYRQIVAIAPHAAATGELGDRLSAKFSSLATEARATEKWDDALHYFEILKTLPAVPLAAISG